MTTFAVVTTIQEPTPALRRLCARLASQRVPLLVIGDRKGPRRFQLEGAELFSLERQATLGLELCGGLPEGHYARKNLGYLAAIARGASCIYETDDDNAPLDGWRLRSLRVEGARRVSGSRWANVYACFSEARIWPRGLPLDRVMDPPPAISGHADLIAPIQQGLADGAPDVDAVWRLTDGRDVRFRPGAPVALELGTFCPFNSQTTWWWPEAFPLMYLPSHCTFRMTDIWRSLVAQRCLWVMDRRLVFHGAEVQQDRNAHRLMDDFRDEVPGYLANDRMAERLAELPLEPGAASLRENLVRCYRMLVEEGWVGADELGLLGAWLRDLSAVCGEVAR